MMPNRISCDMCPKTFASRSGLSLHKQIHSGVKKYICPQCESFSHNAHLKTHILIHSEEKPRNCPQCNFSCNQSANLKVHIKLALIRAT